MGRKGVIQFLSVLHNSDAWEDVAVPYCHTTVEVTLDEIKSHIEFEPYLEVGCGARVACIGSLYVQDKGVVPGMVLEMINNEQVSDKAFEEIIELLSGKTTMHLVLRETFEEVQLDLQKFGSTRNRRRTSSATWRRKSIDTCNAGETPSCSSSLSGGTDSPPGPLPGGGKGDDFEPHPVIDRWPRRLQSDEYLVIFTSRPLGIRVRQDWEEKNAVVWKVHGDFAKKAGVERGSMIYTINEENVSGKKHVEILRLLTESPLPLRIIFWRTLMIDQPRNFSIQNLNQRGEFGPLTPRTPGATPRKLFPMRSPSVSPRRRSSFGQYASMNPLRHDFPDPDIRNFNYSVQTNVTSRQRHRFVA